MKCLCSELLGACDLFLLSMGLFPMQKLIKVFLKLLICTYTALISIRTASEDLHLTLGVFTFGANCMFTTLDMCFSNAQMKQTFA